MIPKEVLKNIRRIQITTAKKASDLFAGEFKSVFKGRGMEFEEVREYLPGDEIRSIDWNVTARMGTAFIKKFIEERELTVMLLLDVSRSSCFGSVNRLKRSLATEVCAVLAAAATKNNDRTGLIVFSDRIELYLPPRKGTNHVFKVIRSALYHEAQGKGTDIPGCIDYLNKVLSKSTVVFLISDFYAENLKKPLSLASKRHDLVAINIIDPRDIELPDVGIIQLDDAETGKPYLLDTSDPFVRKEYNRSALQKIEERKKLFYSVNMDRVDIRTDSSYEEALIQFFRNRRIRK